MESSTKHVFVKGRLTKILCKGDCLFLKELGLLGAQYIIEYLISFIKKALSNLYLTDWALINSSRDETKF